MDDNDRIRLVARAKRASSLSNNELHELKKINSSGLQPFAGDLRGIMDRAHADDDAVLLKVALRGLGSLSGNERYRLDEALNKRGKRLLG